MNMLRLYTIIRFIIPLFLTGAVVFQIVNLELVENNLVEFDHFNWTNGTLLLHFVILFEIFFSFTILFNIFKPKVAASLLLPLSLFYVYDLIMKGGAQDHTLVMTFPYKSINQFGTITVLIGTIILFFSPFKRPLSFRKKVIINLVFVAISSTITFIFYPIFIDDYIHPEVSIKSPKLDWSVVSEKNHEFAISDEEPIFYAFFSTSCYFCNKAAKMLGISNRKSVPAQKIVMIFPGNKEDTEDFIKRNRCDFPYIRISKDEFIKLAGNSYPSFFMVENQKELSHWTGRTLNYPEIDKLFK